MKKTYQRHSANTRQKEKKINAKFKETERLANHKTNLTKTKRFANIAKKIQ